MATVSTSGVVKGIGEGDAKITVTTGNGITATYKISVIDYYADQTYTIDLGSGKTTTVTGHFRDDYVTSLVQELNAYRTTSGLSTLTVDANLTSYAKTRVVEIAYYFSHTRPNGTAVTDISEVFAENIASSPMKYLMDGWKSSSEHNANMLTKGYTKVGIGFFNLKNSDGTYTPYAVQLYGWK